MIEDADEEVASKVRHEESPVLLKHCLGRVVCVIQVVDPHESCIVEQVHGDACGCELTRQVLGRESGCDRLLAENTNLVQVLSSIVIGCPSLDLV